MDPRTRELIKLSAAAIMVNEAQRIAPTIQKTAMDPRTRELIKLSAASVVLSEMQKVSEQQQPIQKEAVNKKLLALLALLGGGGAGYAAGVANTPNEYFGGNPHPQNVH